MADAYPSAILIEFPFGENALDFQTLRSPFEAGYEQTRAKTTIAPKEFSFHHKNISAANVTTWLAFWDAHRGGGEAFNFTDPRTATVFSVRFAADVMAGRDLVQRTGPITYDIGPITLRQAL